MGQRFGQEYGLSLTKESIQRLAILMAYEKDCTPFEKGVSRKTLAKRVNDNPTVKDFLSSLKSIGLWSGGNIPRQEIRRDLERLVRKGGLVKDKSKLGYTTFRRSNRPAPLPDYVLRVTRLTPRVSRVERFYRAGRIMEYVRPKAPEATVSIKTSDGFQIVDCSSYSFSATEGSTTWGDIFPPPSIWCIVEFCVSTADIAYAERLLEIWDEQPLYDCHDIRMNGDKFTGVFTAPCTITDLRR